jgi:hypothetical protein
MVTSTLTTGTCSCHGLKTFFTRIAMALNPDRIAVYSIGVQVSSQNLYHQKVEGSIFRNLEIFGPRTWKMKALLFIFEY